jgi:hypothetical protein
MLRFLTPAVVWCGSLVLLSASASAQWFGRGPFNHCDCAPAAMAYLSAPPVTACDVCAPVVQTACLQPVMQTVYRQVPVVEYQPVKQIAKRPIVETKYVDQAVTEYRPVTETKVVEVPTVTYQDVTECQTVVRNVGYWRTRCEPVCRVSPCEYDPRPGFMGWMNRTTYDLASLFTPSYRTTREYVPQTIAQVVPTTRRIAIQGTRQVAYNVTNLVPYQTTRKVAVAETRWVDEEITVMKPTTVVKTVAVGTQITYQPIGAAGTATAIRPTPETTINARGNNPSRSATTDPLKDADPNKTNKLRSALEPPINRERLTPTALPEPATREVAQRQSAPFQTPTAVRVGQWVARGEKGTTPAATTVGPITVADSQPR